MGIAKIVLSLDGVIKQELELSKDRIGIGRRPYNDMVLDNPAVSGEHAMIVKSHSDYILEDLGSTNGTYVNGQPVKKHYLQNNDVIELMRYRIQYIVALHANARNDALGPDTALMPRQADEDEALAAMPVQPAVLQVLNGGNAGRELSLAKDVTTIGHAGIQLAAVLRRPEGYFIQHVEGANSPLVNDHPIGNETFPLMDGDVIDLTGTQIRFSLL
ncbi:MAG: FHA domain-containing protein [Burkholderiaceae bacterium]|nr:FHA domain-containing protein [Burkholderiaceae bacterium]